VKSGGKKKLGFISSSSQSNNSDDTGGSHMLMVDELMTEVHSVNLKEINGRFYPVKKVQDDFQRFTTMR
jgi:hypothetical protein